MINIPSVFNSPGDAYFYGLSVRQDLDAVHTILGVCPQHDILWGDLTAQEHMELFANLKAIPADRMADDIRVLLEEVQLIKVRNFIHLQFSMKSDIIYTIKDYLPIT